MAVVDGGGSGPTLSPKAKHFERQLFKVFSSSTASIWMTQEDWKGARTQLEDLAKDVRTVRSELQAPPDGGRGWQGPAAEAALASLEKLSATLDGHAVKVGDVDTSLGQVYKAITDAKSAWYSDVASISTHVDPADHTRLPAPYLPTAENASKYSVPDPEAAAAAEDALWEQRNQAAKRVLDQLGVDTQTATATMPIESKDDTETPYSSPGGPGPGGGYPTGTRTPSTSGGHQVGMHPVGTLHLDPDHDVDVDVDGPEIVVEPPPEQTPVDIGDPEPPNTDGDLDPISSDGDTTGTLGPGGPSGPTTPAGSHAVGGGGGGMGAGGMAAGGIGAGAAGAAGLLGARGARGGMPAPGGANQGRGGASGARGSGAGGRGGTAVRAAGGGRGGTTMVPGGGGAAGQSRAGASGRGSSVKGATGSGRYGVPKLDGKGTGMVPAASGQAAKGGGRTGGRSGPGTGGRSGPARGGAVGAAAAGGGRKGDSSKVTDVDKLTHEDEDTWYDGTEESSPQVWD